MHDDQPLIDAQHQLQVLLNQLMGRSRRQVAQLAAILARLEELKVEVQRHQADLAARRRRSRVSGAGPPGHV